MVYRKRNWDELYKEAMEMLKDGYLIKDISSKLGIYRGTIRCWRDGKTIPAKVKIQNEVLKIREKIIISHHFAYLIGIYWGDGYLHDGVFTLRVVDKDFVDLFIQKAENLGFKGGKIRLFPKPTEKCQDQYIISIYSKVLCELILSITDKSKDKLPEFLRNATMECKTEFLRGLFDSDGCVSFGFYKYKGRENYPKLSKSIFLCNENYEFLLFVQEIIDSLGIKSAIREGDGVYNLFISNKAWNVIKFSEIIGFSINRKKEKLRKLIEVIYKQRKTKFKPEEYFETLKLKQEGFSTAEISRKVGINKFTVYDWLYRDVKPRTVES